jgi:hypothetical protein
MAAELAPSWGVAYLVAIGAGWMLLVVAAAWSVARVWRNTRCKRDRQARQRSDPSQMDRGQLEREIDDNLQAGDSMASDARVDAKLRAQIRANLLALRAKQQSQKLEILAFGTISSGKSSLLNALAGLEVFRTEASGGTTLVRSEIPWPGCDRVVLADTPGLAEVDGQARANAAAEAARDADLVLLVVDGPLKEYEFQLLQVLSGMEKRLVVCLNKQDWFSHAEQSALRTQILSQIAALVSPADVVAVRAKPAARRRVRVLSDGTEVDESVPVALDISPLAERLLAIVQRDGRDLLLANLLLQSRGLVADAQRRVLDSLDRHAQQVVSRTMWASAGAVAVNPFPLLDLAGGSAITVKMVLDLARVYRQDVDVDTVVNLLAQLGKSLLAMLGVTAAAPVVAAALATMLKTVPGVGTLAGGLLQGLVQALVIKWIGNVFIAYFRDEMRTPPGGFAQLAREKWREMTQPAALRELIQAGRARGAGSGDGA